MNHSAQQAIQEELSSGERIVWAGTPKQGTLFRGSDILMIPFSLIWGGFAIFCEFLALTAVQESKNTPDAIAIIFPLFGIPFVLVGLYLIFGGFICHAKKRSKTFYGVTNERAIIVSGIFSKSVKSLNLNAMSDLSINEKENSLGTITFGQDNPIMSMFMSGGFPGAGPTVPKFEFIEGAKNVDD